MLNLETMGNRYRQAQKIGRATLHNMRKSPARSVAAAAMIAGPMAMTLTGCGNANPDKCYVAHINQGGVENNILYDMVEQRKLNIGQLSGLHATGMSIQNNILAKYREKGVNTDHLMGGETVRYCIDNDHIKPGHRITLNSTAVEQAANR